MGAVDGAGRRHCGPSGHWKGRAAECASTTTANASRTTAAANAHAKADAPGSDAHADATARFRAASSYASADATRSSTCANAHAKTSQRFYVARTDACDRETIQYCCACATTPDRRGSASKSGTYASDQPDTTALPNRAKHAYTTEATCNVR